jgi:hypothetical protein
MDHCCEGCFADEFLRQRIANSGTVLDAECDWCGSLGNRSIPLDELADIFAEVVDLFFVDANNLTQVGIIDPLSVGEGIGDLLDHLFETFSDDVEERRNELANAILNESVDPQDGDPSYDDDQLWFRREYDWAHGEVTYEVAGAIATLRPFVFEHGPSVGVDITQKRVGGAQERKALKVLRTELARQKTQLAQGTCVFRARVEGRTPLEPTQLGAPPAELINPARANQSGQPVLYVADTGETALAEVRPAVADVVAVGELVLTRSITLCPLLSRGLKRSPFQDPETFKALANEQSLRAELGRELARPIRPSDVAREYLFTQFLANTVRSLGFDGLAYPSSQRGWPKSGTNYALFDVSVARAKNVERFRVTSIEYCSVKADPRS